MKKKMDAKGCMTPKKIEEATMEIIGGAKGIFKDRKMKGVVTEVNLGLHHIHGKLPKNKSIKPEDCEFHYRGRNKVVVVIKKRKFKKTGKS